jgi:hypothetical protein
MPRGLLIFALCVPLAILLGFLLADPMMGSNLAIVSTAIFALTIPIILTVHHRALIWLSGATIIAFFLPGEPLIWIVLAGLSFGITVISRPLNKVRIKPVWEKLLLYSLVFLMASIFFTAFRTGGIGMRILGSSTFGGRKYISLVASFLGFLALTLNVVPRRHAQRDLAIFSLAPATTAISNVAYMLGPAFYWMFLLFPVELALNQAQADLSPVMVGIKRYTGFGPAGTAICMFCLLRWGIRGICQINKPWRLILVVTSLFMGLLSGFRSSIMLPVIVASVQFFAAGLHRTKYVFALVSGVIISFVFLALFSESLPVVAQRAISFMPVKVDPIAAADAKNSMEWRLSMWGLVVQEIPRHLWFGKGYAIDPTDLFLAEESIRRGFINDYEIALRAGDYHSGPLSIIVPFGVVGTLAMLGVFAAGIRVLWNNMRYGDKEIWNINLFLFSWFVGRLIFFVVLFGSIESDLWMFVSALGISLSVNGGMKEPPKKEQMKFEPQKKRGRREPELAPAAV